MFQNEVLVEMYVSHGITCDCLVSNPDTLTHFAKEYTARTGQKVEPAKLSHHMLNLRKLGQNKGGLPRLRRSYNGRGRWRT